MNKIIDTIICKKDLTYKKMFGDESIYFEKNKTYAIYDIEADGDYYIADIEYENSDIEDYYGLWFYNEKSNDKTEINYIYDYFYTKEELRLLKLKSL